MIIKVTLLLGSLFVLTTAAMLNGTIVEGCRSDTEMWGSPDGTKFYFCLGGNEVHEESCAPDTFFVKNKTTSGCVPFSEVSDNCVYHQQLQPCEGENVKQPQTHQDPTKFCVCPAEGGTPIVMSCAPEKAFLKQQGYLGCFGWVKWREVRGCPMEDASAKHF